MGCRAPKDMPHRVSHFIGNSFEMTVLPCRKVRFDLQLSRNTMIAQRACAEVCVGRDVGPGTNRH